MPNLARPMRTSMRHYEVTMHRRPTLNAVQNARRCVAYVTAENPAEAMKAAERQYDKQAFKSVSAREVRP
ncbi:hypothetical protein [Pseudomonas sp.]|uniref:hypothetical protein n=1 Tax=Pseudomonas sp. TaxID=306 RepID=UPI003F3E6351